MSSSPGASRKASSTSRVERPLAYISVTRRSKTSELPSRNDILEEGHERRAKGLAGTSDLGDPHVDGAFGGAQPPALIPVAQASLAASALVAAPPTQGVGLLALQQLLDDQAGDGIHQR